MEDAAAPPGERVMRTPRSQTKTVAYLAVTLPDTTRKFVLPWHKILLSPTSFRTAIVAFKRQEAEQEQHIISSRMQGTALDTTYTARSFNGVIGSTPRL